MSVRTRLKALWRSATVYVSAIIIALPDLVLFLQANAAEVAKYIPDAYSSRWISLLGIATLVARMRSLVKVQQP